MQTYQRPPFRKLRGYAFDPSLSLKMDTAAINEIIYKVPWEPLAPGPTGEYIEVVDYDPTVEKFYRPVNLNNAYILAQDGLEPGEGNPQFHQQMVYAVAMTTISNFEKALGRKILWSDARINKTEWKYVGQLRIYPHALREANAYYSPMKKALLFGYFTSNPAEETMHMPDSLVFTALSHDIIAHETTHAILDGIYPDFNDATGPDVHAFHEAFADIVALFQHFTFPEVLKHQIARTRGDLASQNLLGQLAQEFGSAIGDYGSLRDAIGKFDEETKQWKPHVPDPSEYRTEMEPHARGSILVAAVFEAFLNIYKARVADLLRIASNGTGVLMQGELHPDLVNRLAEEAARSARHVLTMCIRALDYCPPVDLTFGDYLRAIITADYDLVKDDSRRYRLAFIDAFRKRGIYPENIKTLSEDSLRYTDYAIGYSATSDGSGNISDYDENVEQIQGDKNGIDRETQQLIGIINGFLRDYEKYVKYENKRENIHKKMREYIAGRDGILGLHKRLNLKFSNSNDFRRLTGLAFTSQFNKLGIRKSSSNNATFQIQNLRVVSRVGPGNSQVNQVIFSIIQRSAVKLVDDKPVFWDFQAGGSAKPEDFLELKGGCTLIFDLEALKFRYSVTKPLLDPDADRPAINLQRLKRLYDYLDQESHNEFAAYFSAPGNKIMEPFAFLHQH